MSRRKKEQSGIRLYTAGHRSTAERTAVGEVFLFLLRTAAVSLLAMAWWNGFLNVFAMAIEEYWLYAFLVLFSMLGVLWSLVSAGKRIVSVLACGVPLVIFFWKNQELAAAVNYLANAYLRVHHAGTVPLQLYKEPAFAGWILGLLFAGLTIPVIMLWSYVLVKNRGKAAAVLVILVPAVLAAWEGYFLSEEACWILIFCVGFYFAISGSTVPKGAVLGGMAALVCLFVLFLLSSVLVKPIESVKSQEDGLYVKARAAVKENVVQKLADMAGQQKPAETQKEETQPGDDEDVEKAAENEQENPSGEAQAPIVQEPAGSEAAVNPGGDSKDLKSIAYFSPGVGSELALTVDRKPTQTYYFPEEYGGVYDGHAWEPIPLSDEVFPEYSVYPQELRRLIELCRAQKVNTVEEAAGFIQQEFETNTVYDYEPGATPSEQDFAEYFLFENKKGFCVHFATTATLMYRIFGFQARYAQGYAIPPSAFKEQPDGTYTAVITGTMGHAWCETYEDGWKIREHTQPYMGEEPQTVLPAANSSQNPPVERKETNQLLKGILIMLLLLILCSVLFFLQAAVRRQQKRSRCRRYAQGGGILAVYQNLYDIAVFRGMAAAEPGGAETLSALKTTIPEISQQNWDLIQKNVWETMYGRNIPSKEEHEKMYHMMQTAVKEIENQLNGWSRVKYRNIRCFG